MTRKARISTGGLTLLELVIVSVIVVVLAAVAVPRYSSASGRYQVSLAAQRVAADLRQAQTHATASCASCTVAFSASTDTYQLVNVGAWDGRSGSYTVDLAAEPYKADLVSASFGGSSQIVFNGWGLPHSGGTVVVAVRSLQKTVVVNGETGQVSVQ